MNEFFNKGKNFQNESTTLDYYSAVETIEQLVSTATTIEEKVSFINGLLDDTTQDVYFIYVRNIAEKEKNEYIWASLLINLISMLKHNSPNWSDSFVTILLESNDIKLFKDQAHLLMELILIYDGLYSTFRLNLIRHKSWFEGFKPVFRKTILEHIHKISAPNMKMALNVLSSQDFYSEILKKTNDDELFTEVIAQYYFTEENVNGFSGGKDVDDILIKYRDKFESNNIALGVVAEVINHNHTTETGKLFVDILQKFNYKKDLKIRLLQDIHEIESLEVSTLLFELTGDIDYAPSEAKDIFLF